MLAQKTFVRKTRRGNIIKIVREHYLRDDIWCGSPLCKVGYLIKINIIRRFAEPHHVYSDPDPVFNLMLILTWILLLIKAMRICDHRSKYLPGLHFELPRLSRTPF
jgi:hypothetical protein